MSARRVPLEPSLTKTSPLASPARKTGIIRAQHRSARGALLSLRLAATQKTLPSTSMARKRLRRTRPPLTASSTTRLECARPALCTRLHISRRARSAVRTTTSTSLSFAQVKKLSDPSQTSCTRSSRLRTRPWRTPWMRHSRDKPG